MTSRHSPTLRLQLLTESASLGSRPRGWCGGARSSRRGSRDASQSRAFRGSSRVSRSRRPPPPDQSLWSPNRVNAWRKALREPAPAPLAVLRIPKCDLKWRCCLAPMTARSTELVGHIEGPRCRATDGNLGIAGHRDGFFRGLKDIAPGDVIEVETPAGEGRLSRRANLGGRPGRRLGARPDAHPRADTGHLLSLLLRRFRPATVHRPGRARRRPHAPGAAR